LAGAIGVASALSAPPEAPETDVPPKAPEPNAARTIASTAPTTTTT
jgi:hypothetical protein